ncbi:MAG: agmatine deiminase family protein [Elusimicrobiales bacterium]|nr:agmatine deiminase family protein [Elusimicrobiales bacterium]
MKMMILIFNLVFLLNSLFASDIPLPNWVDLNREKKVIEEFPKFEKKATQPPSDFRIPAEYEPIHAVAVSYTGYTTMVKDVAKAVSNYAGSYVWVMSGPSSMSGVPNEKYVKFSIPIDTVWMRDYGPFGLSKSMENVAIVDTVYRHYQYRTNDDAVPKKIGQIQNLSVYQAPLILDGGNFMVDSKGNLFMTERTYMWNSSKSKEEVNNILRNYFKVKNIHTFEYAGYPNEPLDGTGHVDMFIKLLSDDVVLIADCDTEPFKTTFNKAVEFFKHKTSPNGGNYKILRVKSYYRNGVYYTYTNSLIVNGNVLMPVYSNFPQDNSLAKSVYESVGLRVITINSDASISAGGSIHCITQTIPDIGKIIKREKIEIVKPVNNIDIFPLDKLIKASDYFIPN